jgi:hypothetical protein
VQVGENDHRQGVEVDLLGNAQLLLEGKQPHRLRPSVEAGRIGNRGRIQAGVDQDPLLPGLDQIGGDREAE